MGTVRYLPERGRTNRMGLELTRGEIKMELDLWLRLVAPDSSALAAATASLHGFKVSLIARAVHRSFYWVRDQAIPAFVEAWENGPRPS